MFYSSWHRLKNNLKDCLTFLYTRQKYLHSCELPKTVNSKNRRSPALHFYHFGWIPLKTHLWYGLSGSQGIRDNWDVWGCNAMHICILVCNKVLVSWETDNKQMYKDPSIDSPSLQLNILLLFYLVILPGTIYGAKAAKYKLNSLLSPVNTSFSDTELALCI